MAENPTKPDADDLPNGQTEELVAYLDGELDAKSAEAMATKLSLDAKLRAEADSLQRAWDILDVLPKPTPSVSFTSKTISQALPIPSGNQPTLPLPMPSGGRSTMTATVPLPLTQRSGIGFWIAALFIITAAGGGGYLGHALLAPVKAERAAEREIDAQVMSDLPLYKNARLFHNVDDMEYLKQLDSPELFGEEE